MALSLTALTAAAFFSCQKDEVLVSGTRLPVLPATPYAYDVLPATTPDFYNPWGENHTVDNHKATLGRVLFYETGLSLNNRTSCGSCHLQQHAFADPNRVSLGFLDGLGGRNAPPITNAGSQTALFWDMRETNLHEMVRKPIANHIEMGMADDDYLVTKVKSLPYYTPLFRNAYGNDSITLDRIQEGLEHFVRSMVTISSKYDRALENGFAEFTEQEMLGKDLFFAKFPCSGCHGGVNLGGAPTSEMMNIGLDTLYRDPGVPGIDPATGEPRNGWFKVPSLRNVMLTAPYMHDGRFATIDEVINFYDMGIQPHMQLDPMLRMREDGGFHILGPNIDVNALYPGWKRLPVRMFMTNEEREALKAFLSTLTDHDYVRDPKFSDPFVVKN